MKVKKTKFSAKRIKFILLALVIMSILMMGFSTVLGKDVILDINGKTQKVFTYSDTVGDFLKVEKIKIKDNQSVTPSVDTKITQDMKIVISNAKSYNIIDANTKKIVEAKGQTVADVLNNLKIKLNENDRVSPSLDTITKAGMNIKIDRVVIKQKEVVSDVAFEIEKRENKELYTDQKNIIQAGVNGQKKETIKQTFVNGKIESTAVVKTEMVKAPVKQIEEVGTKKIEVPNIKGKKVKRVIVMQATAYDPTAGTKTAMGTKARVGAVAVDPRVVPLGSKLYIESMDAYPSYGYAVAEDTGGAIKGNRIDLFYNTNKQANAFGRRNVKVYVLEN